MDMDHTWDHFNYRRHCRQYSSSITRPSYRLCGFIDSAIKNWQAFYHKFAIDLGRYRCHYSSPWLPDSDLGHQAFWRHEVWRVGMYIRFYSCFLDGSLGRSTRAIYWRVHRRIDCEPGFTAGIQSCHRIFYRVLIWLIDKNYNLFYDAVLCHPVNLILNEDTNTDKFVSRSPFCSISFTLL